MASTAALHIGLTDEYIKACKTALQREKVEGMLAKAEVLADEARKLKKKDKPLALKKHGKARVLARKALALAKSRGFADLVTKIQALLKSLK